MDISCIILAGGKSLRLGHDKIFEKVGNTSLLEKVISRLDSLGKDIILVTAKQRTNGLFVDFLWSISTSIFSNTDRIHDIEAARDTGSLSVGVLFGYGGKEPEQADITISSFDGLLDIFDRRLSVFEKILVEIDQRKSTNRPFVVGISGVDCSGKTMFTESLAGYLSKKKHNVQIVHLDDFHNPKAVRYAGENQAENYYHRSFDIQKIIDNLLIPARRKENHTATLKLLNLDTDKIEIKKDFSFGIDTIVLFEGVFLFREELEPHIDYNIYLNIPFEESKNRAKERDARAVLEKYDTKYIPAQRKYLAQFPPEKTADMIVDNSNWEYPNLIKIRK